MDKNIDIPKEIEILEDKISRLNQTLSLMPQDTFLGRICINGYIKKYTKELNDLKRKKG